MRTIFSMLVAWAGLFALAPFAASEDKKDAKEITVTGTITCARCDLKKSDKCKTVIQGKAQGSDKEEIYWFDEKSDKTEHSKVCQQPRAGTVTGTVVEENGKMVITVTKVTYKNRD
jgi:hypothetical protein